MKIEEDPILIRQLQKGNHLAFNQLYARYFPKLYGFSLKITGNREDAEEIVQEVFTKVWEIRDNLDPEKNFNSLLFTIGKHKIYNKARQRIYRQAYENYVKLYGNRTEDLTDHEISFHEAQFFINKAISLLPEKRREIFILSKIEGLSNKEIAKRLNTSLSNIENNINKALKSIKHHMSENEIMAWLFLAHLSQISHLVNTINF
jgi:RNA polymerase sigma-70 factor, ECF subfamily